MVHFGTGCGQGKDYCQRGASGDELVVYGELPGVFSVVGNGMGYEFGGVYYGASAYGNEVVDVILACQCHGFHYGVIVGIGFYAPELDAEMVFECVFYLLVYTVAFGTAASVTYHDSFFGCYFGGQSGDGAFSENEFGGILECKVFHN